MTHSVGNEAEIFIIAVSEGRRKHMSNIAAKFLSLDNRFNKNNITIYMAQ